MQGPSRRLLPWSLSLTFAAGLLGAWLAAPAWQDRAALRDLASPDPIAREAAWRHLHHKDRVVQRVEAIDAALAMAPDDALLDASDQLDRHGLWSWKHQPRSLLTRELLARAAEATPESHAVVVERIEAAPLDLAPDPLRTAVESVLANATDDLERETLAAFLAWCGPERCDELKRLDVAGAGAATTRWWRSALATCDPPAARGDEAGHAPGHESLRAALAADATRPAWQRRQAAWHLDTIDTTTLTELLTLPVAEPDGSVFPSVLLAERHLDSAEARAQADAWVHDYDDDRKRAGALLTLLLGGPAERLADAARNEDQAVVRTLQHVVLGALGVEGARPSSDTIEFAYRALRGSDDDFRGDIALALLASGHAPTLALLGTSPRGDADTYRLSVQKRQWLLERFVPEWYERLGRPEGGSGVTLSLQRDTIAALYDLSRRRLTFDPRARTYSSGSPTMAANATEPDSP